MKLKCHSKLKSYDHCVYSSNTKNIIILLFDCEYFVLSSVSTDFLALVWCFVQSCIYVYYRQISNLRHTLIGNKIVDHSDVVDASPVGAAPTTSSFST